MNKIAAFGVVAAVLLCFSFNFASSAGIKISPARSSLEMNAGEINCTTIWVYPDREMMIRTRWSNGEAGNILQYKIDANKLGIKISFNKTRNGEYLVCFESSNSGLFHGAILFSQENNDLGIGTWVDLNVRGRAYKDVLSSITANAIASVESKTDAWLFIIFFLLFIILIIITLRLIRSLRH